MSTDRGMKLGLALALASSACSGGGGPDSGPPDAPRCAPEDLVDRVPVENASALAGGDLDLLFGYRGGTREGIAAAPQDDGSLIVWNTRSVTSMVELSVDGQIRPVRHGPYGEMRSDGAGLMFRAYDGASAVGTGEPVLFSFEAFSIDSGETIAEAEPFPLPSVCDGVGPYSPHVSDGRYLTIRAPCGAGPRRIAERWEDRGGTLEVVAGPYGMPDADSGGINRSAFADGRGGLFFLGIPPRLIDGSDRRLVVTHWDGDTAPVESESIGPLGTTTDFGRATPYRDGTLAAAVNHVIDGELTTVVARVDRDARILWTWQSPDGFFSGPNYPAIAIAGAQELIVVLVRPRELRTAYVMRLDPLGRPRWAEPRALPWPGLFDIELTAVVGHPTGTFHVGWFPGSIGWFDAEAEPLWDEPLYGGTSDFARLQMFADGREGIWLTDSGFMGGYVAHYDTSQWSLFRVWGYPGCGGRRGIVTRESPDAEPRTWWGPFPFGNAP